MPNSKPDLKLDLSRRNLLRSAGLMGLLVAAPGCAGASAATSLASAKTGMLAFPLLTAEMQSYVAEKKVSAMMAAIGFGAGDPQYISEGTIAIDSAVPADKDTLWRIYSMTKPVTGMAAMILIDEGKLTLDMPVAEILPEFANMKVLTDPAKSLDAVPAKTQMTVRHLLTHTAGLGYNIITKGPLLNEYNRLGIAPGVVSKQTLPGFPVPAPTPSIDEFSKRVASLPLIAEPGSTWSYSIALDLLGYVIQQASGMEFGAFLQSRMFDPLGMTSTFFQVPESETSRFATNYAPVGPVLFPIDPASDSIYTEKPAFPFGGAGLVSSARDYDRFLAMLLGKGALGDTRIMSERAAVLGMSNILPEGADLKGTWVEGQGFGAGGRVGLGTANGPKGTFGWGGAAGTVAFVDNVRGFRAAGYTQYMPADAYPFQQEFGQLVYRDLMGG